MKYKLHTGKKLRWLHELARMIIILLNIFCVFWKCFHHTRIAHQCTCAIILIDALCIDGRMIRISAAQILFLLENVFT